MLADRCFTGEWSSINGLTNAFLAIRRVCFVILTFVNNINYQNSTDKNAYTSAIVFLIFIQFSIKDNGCYFSMHCSREM